MANLPASFATLQKIVSDRQCCKVIWPNARGTSRKAMLVDVTTARAIIALHDALERPELKARVVDGIAASKARFVLLANFAFSKCV
jgi:DNA primase